MEPVAAGSADEALQILASDKAVDGVLADIGMRRTDGVQLARASSARSIPIPFIAMDHPGMDRDPQEMRVFTSVLFKPVRLYLLRQQLLDAFNKTGADQQTVNSLSAKFSELFPLRILIAEDNLVNQKIATKILSKLGYQPDIVNNGKEALEIVSQKHYDIILMDVQMPEMDGLEATRMIRTCLEVQPIIIAMTANVMQGDRDACMQSGMDDYMSKPIELKELLSHLEKWSLVLKDRRKIA
jgi:CheY-like chemotaxis protein